MNEGTGKLPGIKNVQVKLTQEEYDALWDLAAAARMRVTPFARDLFLRAIQDERQRNQRAAANKGEVRPFRKAPNSR